jgi:hypothetical protein
MAVPLSDQKPAASGRKRQVAASADEFRRLPSALKRTRLQHADAIALGIGEVSESVMAGRTIATAGAQMRRGKRLAPP